MKIEQENTPSMPALLCNVCGVDAQKIKSLCCEAAGIIDPVSATAEALIPHEKLREAASVDATLIARERPPAQPVVGYKPPLSLTKGTSMKRSFRFRKACSTAQTATRTFGQLDRVRPTSSPASITHIERASRPGCVEHGNKYLPISPPNGAMASPAGGPRLSSVLSHSPLKSPTSSLRTRPLLP